MTPPAPTEAQGQALLRLARAAIASQLGRESAQESGGDWLKERGATFVTLTREGRLRGCIGSLEAYRPLADDVRANARAAAFQDPRFPPLSAQELDGTRMEVSLLSPLHPLTFSNEEDAIAQLRPGVDGVVLECSLHRGTFLPQVWEQLPDPRQFMAHLKMKAGLPPDFWSSDLKLYRYTVAKWKET